MVRQAQTGLFILRRMLAYLKQYLPPLPRGRDCLGLALLPVLIACVLLVLDRYGLQTAFVRDHGAALARRGFDGNDIQFFAQVYFSGACLFLFVAVPVVYQRLFPSISNDPFGLGLRGCVRHLPVYALLFFGMLPLLWWAAARPGFYLFYPFYKPDSPGMWLLFEAVYMLQFFAVEFFFRGFCLFRLEARFGLHAVTVMMVPYALIHIHKPFLEALSSIPAGLVLGWLALKCRSIWPGVGLHCSVALSMDVLALSNAGRLSALF